jgi:hypothetical protein
VHNPGGTWSWWTCHKDTVAGDLVMLYRSAPESDVAYILEATSNARLLERVEEDDGFISFSRFRVLVQEADVSKPDAYKKNGRFESFSDEWRAVRAEEQRVERMWEQVPEGVEVASEHELSRASDEWSHWETDFWGRVFDVHDMEPMSVTYPSEFGAGTFVCDWRPRFKFEAPLKLADLKADPWLAKNWNALRANFIQRAFRMKPDVWTHTLRLAEKSGNDGIEKAVHQMGGQGPSADIMSEQDLEDRLAADPTQIPGYDLELVGDGYLGTGRQVSAGGGWIDLLGVDRSTGKHVVVELKAVRAGRNAVGQVMAYVGWVAENLSGGSPVEALVISDGVDTHFASAVKAIPNLRQIDISDLGV